MESRNKLWILLLFASIPHTLEQVVMQIDKNAFAGTCDDLQFRTEQAAQRAIATTEQKIQAGTPSKCSFVADSVQFYCNPANVIQDEASIVPVSEQAHAQSLCVKLF